MSQLSLSLPLPLLPLRHGVVLPGSVVSVPVGRAKSRALADAVPIDGLVLLGVQRDPQANDPPFEQLLEIGVLARLRQKTDRGPRGLMLMLEGLERVRLEELAGEEPYLRARGEKVDEPRAQSTEAHAIADSLRQQLMQSANVDRSFRTMLDETRDPGRLADRLAVWIDSPAEQRVSVLIELDVPNRLRKVMELLTRARVAAELREQIDGEVRRELGKNQKEAVLREQLKAIRKQLGDEGDDLDAIRRRIEEADLPPEAREVVQRELRRLESMGTNNPDYHIGRKYLELVSDLPWNKRAPASDDLNAVETILKEDHEGLDDVKKRILEHMAVLKLAGNSRGTILCLVGPPGVGKTSLAQSVARATGRPLQRVSLGGVRDEAEIRGHRRTYIGALPGRIIQSLRKVGTNNPVFLLDEVDKM
ncbi:MAG: LON peptidase substrate-binding domain-containing protein, partial [Sandaracinaceae bacterium]|nr:LON peptidase substrate-binding domain-containing protein [Sandaracinaceae bacterium]